MKNHTIPNYTDPKIGLWHNFEMSKFTVRLVRLQQGYCDILITVCSRKGYVNYYEKLKKISNGCIFSSKKVS